MIVGGHNIECITFDLDDTLWHCEPVVVRAERVFFAWLQQEFPQISKDFDFTALVKHRHSVFKEYPDLFHDFSQLRRKWLERLVEQYACDSRLIDEGFAVFLKARNEVELFEGAEEVLSMVKKRYRCGSITNGNADVGLVGIGAYFDFSITAAGAGAGKPSPIIFEAAIQAAGVAPENILHIGDDAARDVKGAAQAGMQTVWINPEGLPWVGKNPPNLELRYIHELFNLL